MKIIKKKKVYWPEMEARIALASKKDQEKWTIQQDDNGWYHLEKTEGRKP